MSQEPLIIIAGPTGVGKSHMAIRLAKRISGEIISADSMQLYRGMDIGTAKVTKDEQEGVRHHLLDVVSPLEAYSVARYKEDASRAAEEIRDRGHLPVVVGGTGFYIQALLYDIDFNAESGEDTGLRAYYSDLVGKYGSSYLHKQLEAVDPESAALIHPNNTKRVIRALEYHAHTGKRISAHNREQSEKTGAYKSVFFVMTDTRKKLYDRIDRRVIQMLDDGLIYEVKALLKEGCTPDLPSMQALGYKETLRLLMNLPDPDDTESFTNDDLEQLRNEIAKNTRHYAKRQLTWFKREPEAIWLSWEEYNEDEMLERMLSILKENGIAI